MLVKQKRLTFCRNEICLKVLSMLAENREDTLNDPIQTRV